jgi:hypothetical protein
MDEENIIVVPGEDRAIVVAAEPREIEMPAESRTIEIRRDLPMLQMSKIHTAGNTIRWKVDYNKWLDNAAEIASMNVTSSSTTCTVGNIQILGRHIYFFLVGGAANEQPTVSLAMTDTFGNIKHDSIHFTVVAP